MVVALAFGATLTLYLPFVIAFIELALTSVENIFKGVTRRHLSRGYLRN